jgi:anti-sigma factor RsiW
MTCREFEENVYVWDLLSEAERTEAETHRQQCKTCQSLAAEVQQSREWIAHARHYPPQVPDHSAFTHRIMKAVVKPKNASVWSVLKAFVARESLRYAFSVLSILLISDFAYEWQAADHPQAKKWIGQAKITLDTSMLMENLRKRKENKQDPPFSLYAHYKEKYRNEINNN